MIKVLVMIVATLIQRTTSALQIQIFQVYWIDILVLFGFFVFLRVMGYFVLKLKLKMDR